MSKSLKRVWLLSFLVIAVLVSGCLGPRIRSHKLTIAIQGEGTITPDEGTHSRKHKTTQDLLAKPAPGWQFVRWIIKDEDGEKEIQDSATAVYVDQAKQITAVFTKIQDPPTEPTGYTLTITVEGGGSVTPGTGTHDYSAGDVVELKAEPVEDCKFIGWFIGGVEINANGTEGLTDKEISITMDEDKVVTAVFSKEGCSAQTVNYTLTAATQGEGTVTPETGIHNFEENQQVILTAKPAAGWNFSHWIIEDHTGTKEYDDREVSLEMASNTIATAVFAKSAVPPTSYTLTVSTEGEGLVTPEVGTYEILENEQTELQATPAEGWEFVKWTIDGEGGSIALAEQSISVKMDGTKDITAVFTEMELPTFYTLTVSVDGQGTVTPGLGTHEFAKDEQANLGANPKAGWEFVEWIIKDEGGTRKLQDKNISLKMDSDKAVKAKFTASHTYTLTVRIIGRGSTSLPEGEHQIPAGTSVSIPANPADGWEHYGWVVDRPGDVGEIIQGSWNWGGWKGGSLSVGMNDDIVVTVVFANDFSELTMEHAYIVDSFPAKGSTLRITNQTNANTGYHDYRYAVGYPVRIETFSGRTDSYERYDRFEGWRIRSTATGAELNPEDYFANYKERVTTVTMPGEDVTITAEWIRFAHTFGVEQGQRGNNFRSTEQSVTHYFDLMSLPTDTEITFGFHPRAIAPVRYKVYYGTREDMFLPGSGELLFNTGWVSTKPEDIPEDMVPYYTGGIRRYDWHEAIELDSDGANYRRLIKKRSGYDYVMVTVERPYEDTEWRYWFYVE